MLETAKKTLLLEAEAIRGLIDRLDHGFEEAVLILEACQGRVVVIGMGKSGLIGTKIAATLASTGTPSFFLHPAEGSHGDIGMVTRNDVVLALSNSGETEEVIRLMPVIKRMGLPLISLVGRVESSLARLSTVVLDCSVEREACPLGLAPTCSTTAALAMGDALAIALLEKRGLSSEQFALFHPGGSLGKKLLLHVSEQMQTGKKIPLISANHGVREAVLEISAKRLGLTGVTDTEGHLIGIITDGDLRRWLTQDEKLLDRKAMDIMTKNPKTISAHSLAAEAIHIMEGKKITSLFITDDKNIPIGVIHLHDLLETGIV